MPLHLQKTPKSKVTTQNATSNFDYTAIADRLKTVSLSDDRNQDVLVHVHTYSALCISTEGSYGPLSGI